MCGWAAPGRRVCGSVFGTLAGCVGGSAGGAAQEVPPPQHSRLLSFCLRQLPLAPNSTPGYLTLKEVFSYGALMTIVNLTIWGVLGGAWWKALGFF